VFHDEEKILDHNQGDRNLFYDMFIAPYKGELEIWYSQHRNMRINLLLIFFTVWILIKPESSICFSVFKGLPPIPNKLKEYMNSEK
jgi:hypothetical protein